MGTGGTGGTGWGKGLKKNKFQRLAVFLITSQTILFFGGWRGVGVVKSESLEGGGGHL